MALGPGAPLRRPRPRRQGGGPFSCAVCAGPSRAPGQQARRELTGGLRRSAPEVSLGVGAGEWVTGTGTVGRRWRRPAPTPPPTAGRVSSPGSDEQSRLAFSFSPPGRPSPHAFFIPTRRSRNSFCPVSAIDRLIKLSSHSKQLEFSRPRPSLPCLPGRCVPPPAPQTAEAPHGRPPLTSTPQPLLCGWWVIGVTSQDARASVSSPSRRFAIESLRSPPLTGLLGATLCASPLVPQNRAPGT